MLLRFEDISTRCLLKISKEKFVSLIREKLLRLIELFTKNKYFVAVGNSLKESSIHAMCPVVISGKNIWVTVI